MELQLYNRQRRHRVDLAALQERARRALPLCLARPGDHECSLPLLDHVEISLLSDRAIAPINQKFLGHAGPTDVITFQHGEILIGVDTARLQSEQHDSTIDREIALYVVHGLLHLNGWSDQEPAEASRMQALQEKVLAQILHP